MNEKELILAVIETFPSVVGTSFGKEGDDETRAVVECFQEIICTDRAYLIPAIGTLGMLNLPAELQQSVFTLAVNALSIVPEDDMPSGILKPVIGMVVRINTHHYAVTQRLPLFSSSLHL